MEHSLLYVRVSSKEQEREGYSLDAQEKLGEEYALRNDIPIKKRWKVSESAWKEERDSFNELIDYAKKHDEVRHIIFDVTDRMTRNDVDKIKIYTLIKLYDKTIHFSRSNKKISKNSGSEDEFMMDIEVAVAKKMSNDISRKTKMGMDEKAKQGYYPSVAPLGYINSPITHLIELDPEKAPFVKRAFELAADGYHSTAHIADILYNEGFRTRKGSKVGKSTVHFFLGNPLYYGAFVWRGTIRQGSHTPIISKEIYDKAQQQLHGKYYPRESSKGFPFNNIVRCGICGCKVLAERKKGRYNYYHCTFSKGRHANSEYVREETLAEMFGESVRMVTIPEDIAEWLKDALREGTSDARRMQEDRLNLLAAELGKANARLSRLYDIRCSGDITDDVFKLKENEYKQQIIDMNAQVASAKATNPNMYEDGCTTFELSKRLYSQYKNGTFTEKADILKLIASNFTLKEKTLYPTYKKPFDILVKGFNRTKWLGV
jgi:DNA invertase Pin-like site-specific DNA recombinase